HRAVAAHRMGCSRCHGGRERAMKTRPSSRMPAVVALTAVLFAIVAITPSTALAAVSGGWHNLGDGGSPTIPSVNPKVETLVASARTLFVGGDFTNAGGIPAADHIASWDGTHWHAIGGGLGDAPSAVYAIAVDGTNVYAGGSFQNAGGDSAA